MPRTKQRRQQQQNYYVFIVITLFAMCVCIHAQPTTNVTCAYFVIMNVTKMQKKQHEDEEEEEGDSFTAYALLLSILNSYYLFTLSHLLCLRP